MKMNGFKEMNTLPLNTLPNATVTFILVIVFIIFF